MMPHEEKYGIRDFIYSQWHRAKSSGRYIGIEPAQRLTLIDIDSQLWVEADGRYPVGLIEAARYTGHHNKNCSIIKNLANMAGIPALVVFYEVADFKNTHSPMECNDITCFHVKQIAPVESAWSVLTPKKYAELLLSLRDRGAKTVEGIIYQEEFVAPF